MNDNKFRAYLAWIAICFIWGTTYLAIRVGVEELPPLLFAGLRWIAAGIIFLGYLKLRGYKLPARSELKHIALIGILLLGVANGLVVFAEQWIPSGLTALLITTLPFWIVGIESFLPKGAKFNYKILIGLLIGFSGVSLIFGHNIESLLEPAYLIGVFALLAAVISWSIGSLYSKYRISTVHPYVSASVQMLIAGSAQTLLGLLFGEAAEFSFTQNSLLAFLYLIIFGSIFGFGSYIYAIAHLPISLVTTYAYINPLIALFLGWLILDEKINLPIILGALIIFIGVFVVKKGSDIKVTRTNFSEVK